MFVVRQFRSRVTYGWGCGRALFSAQAQADTSGGLPDFFAKSDLSQATSNIGLARRRDLTFRQDIRLHVDGQSRTLKDVLKGQKVLVFGVPDCGKVCSEQVAGYLAELGKLRQAGITKILCVTVAEPTAVQQWAAGLKIDPTQIEVAADSNSSWTRFLGLELSPPGQPGPKSLRYAAVVDDGILLKLKVDAEPGKLEQSSAASMLQLLKGVQHWGT